MSNEKMACTLKVKRGVKWSIRRVELDKDFIKYYDPSIY